MTLRWFKCLALTTILSIGLLTGCGDDFNPRAHMTELVTNTDPEQFEGHQEYMLEHTADHLKDFVQGTMSEVMLDPKYKITQQHMWSEQYENQYIILADYEVVTSSTAFFYIAYYVYVDDKLVYYDYTRADSAMLRMTWGF